MSGAADDGASGEVSAVDIAASPDRVFDVLLDPTTYPDWLRGAKRIREVDTSWPEPGSAFHHVVGAGPLALADKTTVVGHARPRHRSYAPGPVPPGWPTCGSP